MVALPMCSAHARSYPYIITFQNLQKVVFQKAPCPSWMSQISVVAQDARTMQVNSDPLQGAWRGGHVSRAHTYLPSKGTWVCDTPRAGSVGDSCSITVFDTCKGSHLFFLREFEKNSLLVVRTSCWVSTWSTRHSCHSISYSNPFCTCDTLWPR